MGRILGDFKELENKVATGELEYDEFQRIFTNSRKHGLDNSIFPFAVGGSDAGTIIGESSFKTPVMLYREKMGEYEEKPSEEKELSFFIGHVFETPFRDLFAKKEPLCYATYPYYKQTASEEYPHCVANIDGLAVMFNKEESAYELWLYEGKTTSSFEYRKMFREGHAPNSYIIQTQFYMEVIDRLNEELIEEIDPNLLMLLSDFEIKGAVINCGWSIDEEGMKQVYVKRNKDFGKEILDACESFVLNAEAGKRPTNVGVVNLKLLKKEEYANYGEIIKGTATIPAKYSGVLDKMLEIEEKEKPLKEKMSEMDNEVKIVKEKYKEVDSAIKELDKIKDELLGSLMEVIQNKTHAVLETDEYSYDVEYDGETKPSLDKEVKRYWKEKYPECFDDVNSYKVKNTRKNIKVVKKAK